MPTMLQTAARLPGFLSAVARNRRRVPGPPRFLTYTVTFTCNARCIMCDSWKMTSPDDLTMPEIDRIMAQLPPLDAVRITGGEPTARKDLVELVATVIRHTRPLVLHVTTNGFLTDRIVELAEKRDRGTPLFLLVSVDGEEAKHNHVRGRDTAWAGVTRTLEALAPRAKELNLKLAINQTIVDPEGVEHYARLRARFAPLGVTHNAVMAYDSSATYNLEKNIDIAPTEMGQFATFGDFTTEHFDALLAEVEADLPGLPAAERAARRYYWKGIAARLRGEGVAAPNPPCVALNAHLRIFPNGDVPVCQFNTRTAGNLRRQSFKEVWEGPDAARERDWVNRCPGCWAECEVLPSAIYTGDLLRDALAG